MNWLKCSVGIPELKSVLILEDIFDTRQWIKEVVLDAFPGCEIDEAATIQQAKKAIAEKAYQLAIIDLSLPDGKGNEVLKQLNISNPSCYRVVATIYHDDQYLFSALKDGAHGYLLKEQSRDELIRLLKGILNDEPPLSPSIARRILRHFSHLNTENETEKTTLTAREIEVLTCIAKGFTRPEIAQVLGIKSSTVATFTKSVYYKLGVSSRAQAALEANRLGLVNSDSNR